MSFPYRVIDLTDARGELGPAVLASLGAEVIRVEPPSGNPSREAAPLDPAAPEGLRSLRFHAFNRGKKSVVIDLESAAGRERFRRLLATADFLFENAAPGEAAARGFGFEEVRAASPRIVHVAITPFGQDGPYAGHRATDLTIAAMGGMMALNGDPDRRPVRISVPQTWFHASIESVVGALVAHERRLASGEAQLVDVSAQAAIFWTGLSAMIAHAIDGKNVERSGTILQLPTLKTPIVFPCKDGEVVLITTKATLDPMIPWMLEDGTVSAEWVAAEDWKTYEIRMLTGQPLAHSLPEVQEKVVEFCSKYTKLELFERGIRDGATLAPVNTIADVLALEHLRVRDYWETVRLPSGRELRAPGPFAKLSATPASLAGKSAPRVGEHDAEILGALENAEPPAAAAIATSRKSSALPFEGLKVADFAWIGVGPITAKYFADHGATVVHVETESPADRLRLVGPFKDGKPGPNRCQFFASFNTSKLSLALNLKRPEGLEVAERLIRWADLCLDSFTPGTMADLGIGWEQARKWNPSLVMASTCLMGQTGPAARLAGYGYHAAAVSGFYEVTGWDDRPPAGPFMAYTDTIAPRFLATALMVALDHRRRTGEGQFVDQAQMESSLHFLAPEILEQQVTGRSPRRSGNEDPFAFPHDAYPCAGKDQWIAIAIETDDDWRALRRAMGDPEWARASDLDGVDGRRANRERVDEQIAAFTSTQAPRALMERLQAAGVPAGMVQRSSDHLEDPQLLHRKFFHPMVHPEMGEIPYEGHQFRIAGYENGPRFPAPCLGEHTIQVLTEILGYGDEDLARLAASDALR